MNFRLLHVGILIALFILAGCETVSKIENEKNALDFDGDFELFKNAACCENIENIVVDKIDRNTTINFSLRENKKKIKVGEGSSFYKAIEIAKDGDVLDYQLRSFIYKDKETKQSSAVIPIVAVLNNDFTISRVSSAKNLIKNNTPWSKRLYFGLYVRINKIKHPNEKYILIFTEESSLGKGYFHQEGVSRETITAIPTADGAIFVPSGGSPNEVFDVMSLPIGELSIKHITNPLDKPFEQFRW